MQRYVVGGGKDLLCTDFPALALSLVAPPSPLLGGGGRSQFTSTFPQSSLKTSAQKHRANENLQKIQGTGFAKFSS